MEEYLAKLEIVGVILIVLALLAFTLYCISKVCEIRELLQEDKAYALIEEEEQKLIKLHEQELQLKEKEDKRNDLLFREKVKTEEIIREEERKRTFNLKPSTATISVNSESVPRYSVSDWRKK